MPKIIMSLELLFRDSLIEITLRNSILRGPQPVLSRCSHRNKPYLAIIGFATASISLSFATISSSSAPGFESSHCAQMNTCEQQLEQHWRRRSLSNNQEVSKCLQGNWGGFTSRSTATKLVPFSRGAKLSYLHCVSTQTTSQYVTAEIFPKGRRSTQKTKNGFTKAYWSTIASFPDANLSPGGAGGSGGQYYERPQIQYERPQFTTY